MARRGILLLPSSLICFCCTLLLILLLVSTKMVTGCEHHHHHEKRIGGGHQHQHSTEHAEQHHHHHSHDADDDDLQHFRNLTATFDDADTFSECGSRSLTPRMLELDQARMKEWQQSNSNIFERSGSRKTYEIPVYIHVLQSGILTGRVPAKRTNEYMDYLNDAFRGSNKWNTPFVFRHVKTTWTINSVWSVGCGDIEIEKEFKTELRVGGAESLNVYFCDEISNGRGGFYAGYAYPPFPGSNSFVRDGVVLSKSATGESRLNTLVHEVGHFLGLLHTFEGNSCDPNNPGDLVRDTPTHLMSKSLMAAINCKTNPVNWNSCPALTGRDPVDNYMTYSTDNRCRSKFTPGQTERMLAQYELYRKPNSAKWPPAPPVLRKTGKPTSAPTTPAPTPAPTQSPTRGAVKVPTPSSSSPPYFSFLSYFSSVSVQSAGVGAKIEATPTCSSVFATCKHKSDCCSGSCVYMFYSAKSICWV